MTATKKGRTATRKPAKKPAMKRMARVVKIEAVSWDGELHGEDCKIVWVKGRAPRHAMGVHDDNGLDTVLEVLKDEYEEQDSTGYLDREDMDDDEKEAVGPDDLVGADEVVIRFRRLKKEPPGYAAVMRKIRDKAARQRRENERKGAPAP